MDQKDGFTDVKHIDSNSRKFDGLSFTKNVAYHPKQTKTSKASTHETSKLYSTGASTSGLQAKDVNVVKITNPFDVLSTLDVGNKVDDETGSHSNNIPNDAKSVDLRQKVNVVCVDVNIGTKQVSDLVNEDSNSKVKEVYNETTNFMTYNPKVDKASSIGTEQV
ncbi:hypothetical protein Tco_0163382 [Tanacetum coccineum]